MPNIFYYCDADGRLDVVFAYEMIDELSYVWCVKGTSGHGSSIPTCGFGLIRLNASGSELYGFEEIDYAENCSCELFKYACEGGSVSSLVVDESVEPEELNELRVTAAEMAGLSKCEDTLDDYYYMAEEDEDPDCGYFLEQSKRDAHGDSYHADAFDPVIYKIASHVNQAGTHICLF